MAGPPYGSSRIAAILFAIVASALSAQAPNSQQKREPPVEEIPYVLHITTREVVVDLIAVDGHDRTVSGLASGELRVTEKLGKSDEIPESISSFRLVDPSAASSGDLPQTA